jgi:hypothetical protein
MTFEEIVDQALPMLQRRRRVGYRILKRQFQLDDEALEDLKAELIEVQQLAVDQDGTMLVWTGEPGNASPLAPQTTRAPLAALVSTSLTPVRMEADLIGRCAKPRPHDLSASRE